MITSESNTKVHIHYEGCHNKNHLQNSIIVMQDTIMYQPYYRGNMHPKESMQVKMQNQSLVPDQSTDRAEQVKVLKQDEDGWVHLAPWTRGNRREYIILDGCDFYVSLERSDQIGTILRSLAWPLCKNDMHKWSNFNSPSCFQQKLHPHCRNPDLLPGNIRLSHYTPQKCKDYVEPQYRNDQMTSCCILLPKDPQLLLKLK